MRWKASLAPCSHCQDQRTCWHNGFSTGVGIRGLWSTSGAVAPITTRGPVNGLGHQGLSSYACVCIQLWYGANAHSGTGPFNYSAAMIWHLHPCSPHEPEPSVTCFLNLWKFLHCVCTAKQRAFLPSLLQFTIISFEHVPYMAAILCDDFLYSSAVFQAQL